METDTQPVGPGARQDLELKTLESDIELVRANLATVRQMGDKAAIAALEERLIRLTAEFTAIVARS